MQRWMILALLSLAWPAAAQRPPGGPPGAHGPPGEHGPLRDLSPEDQKAIHDFKLTTSITDKLFDASQRIRTAAEKDPSMEKANPMLSGKSIDENAKKMEGHAQVMSAVKGAGLTPKEFLVSTYALMTATIWSNMKKSMPQAQPPAYVNPDNVKFVEEHPEVLQKFQTAWQKSGRPGAPHQ